MKNFVQQGDTLDLILTANVASGGVTIQGSIVGVAVKAGVIGETVAHKTTGVYDLPYGVAATVAAGDKMYWDGSKVTKTASGNTLIGHATEARASSAATARVKLVPVP